MSDIEIIKLVFGILLSLGTITLFLLAYILFYKYLIQEKRCTQRVTGTVRKYTLFSYGGDNSSIRLPVVYYTVNGKEYKVVGPEYRAFKRITKLSSSGEDNVEFNEMDQVFTQVSRVKRTGYSTVRISGNPIAQRYPVHSEVDVYYDPENPKLAYVLRYCNKRWAFWLMFAAGVAVLITDILILMM